MFKVVNKETTDVVEVYGVDFKYSAFLIYNKSLGTWELSHWGDYEPLDED